jgi:hypothetical protein
MAMKKELCTNILMRILATFAASGLGVIGAGAVAGVPLWKAVFMAGIAGVASVVEGLSRAFLDDGKLTISEINNVFKKYERGDVSDQGSDQGKRTKEIMDRRKESKSGTTTIP